LTYSPERGFSVFVSVLIAGSLLGSGFVDGSLVGSDLGSAVLDGSD
jgi:hypothetical protein